MLCKGCEGGHHIQDQSHGSATESRASSTGHLLYMHHISWHSPTAPTLQQGPLRLESSRREPLATSPGPRATKDGVARPPSLSLSIYIYTSLFVFVSLSLSLYLSLSLALLLSAVLCALCLSLSLSLSLALSIAADSVSGSTPAVTLMANGSTPHLSKRGGDAAWKMGGQSFAIGLLKA